MFQFDWYSSRLNVLFFASLQWSFLLKKEKKLLLRSGQKMKSCLYFLTNDKLNRYLHLIWRFCWEESRPNCNRKFSRAYLLLVARFIFNYWLGRIFFWKKLSLLSETSSVWLCGGRLCRGRDRGRVRGRGRGRWKRVRLGLEVVRLQRLEMLLFMCLFL